MKGDSTLWTFRGFTLLCVALLLGCGDSSTGPQRRGPAQVGARGGLFESVVENFDKFEQFDTAQIHKQTCDRLNQWYLQELPKINWQSEPLLDGLSSELRNQPELSDLETVRFESPDGWYLQEAVWLRNISNHARADQFDDVAVGERLFDWVVRNVQLLPASSGPPAVRHRPFEIVLYGRGSDIERAWIFALLARQQGLNVVYLGLADESGQNVRPWLAALLSRDQLYLFDTRLGLPIPGQQPGSIATLSEVIEHPELLRKLDLDAEHPYPVTADDLKHVVAYVEASPPALSRRMALVESRLTGTHRMSLTSPGSSLATRVAAVPHVQSVALWPMPFEVYRTKSQRTTENETAAAKEAVLYQAIPTLRMGRVLHFKGQLDGDGGAKSQYLNSRPPDSYILDYRLAPDDARRLPRESWSKIEAAQSLLMREAKQDASLWLGIIFFEQQDYPNAVDFLAKRTLGTGRATPRDPAARFNLARTYEAQGQTDLAIQTYESHPTDPQSHGNRLRARWLKEAASADAAASPPADGKPAPESTPAADTAPADTATPSAADESPPPAGDQPADTAPSPAEQELPANPPM